jgi:hypothetical protein
MITNNKTFNETCEVFYNWLGVVAPVLKGLGVEFKLWVHEHRDGYTFSVEANDEDLPAWTWATQTLNTMLGLQVDWSDDGLGIPNDIEQDWEVDCWSWENYGEFEGWCSQGDYCYEVSVGV